VARVEKAAQAAQQAADAAASQPPAPPVAAPDEVTSSIGQPVASVPLPAPLPPPTAPIPAPAPGRAEFGIDLGSAANVEGLRTLWAATLRRYSTLLEGLRPVVQMHERRPGGGVDLHLVVGPIPN